MAYDEEMKVRVEAAAREYIALKSVPKPPRTRATDANRPPLVTVDKVAKKHDISSSTLRKYVKIILAERPLPTGENMGRPKVPPEHRKPRKSRRKADVAAMSITRVGEGQWTLLDKLRNVTAVDCDTLDFQVAKQLGPFVDCTSNQAIAYTELTKVHRSGVPIHQKLIADSLRTTQTMLSVWADVDLAELAVEYMMVGLLLEILPYVTGYVHIQTNPKWSYSTERTIKTAERLVAHFKYLEPDLDTKRVCIKIPSTWEGLQACRELEKKGIATLATTMFCMEQAVLAADADCTYIAPYVNELKVHFPPSYTDTDKAFFLCGAAQEYFDQRGFRTKVLPASLTSIHEVMRLAGVKHITVSPPLLVELEATKAKTWPSKEVVGDVLQLAKNSTAVADGTRLHDMTGDESAWRLAFTRSGGGKNEAKLVQAINIFCDMQESLEKLARDAAVQLRS